MRKNLESILEWGSTIVLIVGVAFTSFNIYPMNVWLSLAGNLGWFFVAIAWRKTSLIIIQCVMCIIYIAGLISKGIIHV